MGDVIDTSDVIGSGAAGGTRRRFGLKRVALAIGAIAGLAVAAQYGTDYWRTGRFLVDTDDAYVEADSSTIAPRVSGYIDRILVEDNQWVKAGAVLATIDDRDLRTALAEAAAARRTAEAQIANIDAQLRHQQSVIDQAQAHQASVKAALVYANQERVIPGAQVGAVLLTNTDSGAAMRGPFIRRLLELLYDGKPEAEETVKASAGAIKAAVAAERKQLVYPADPKITSGLAARYTSPDLGSMAFTRSDSGLSGSNGVWSIAFATKANPDGTVSLVTASPGLTGLEFVVANEGGKRALVVRDGQHVYRYAETQ